MLPDIHRRRHQHRYEGAPPINAMLATLPEKDMATSTVTYSFLGSFGLVWSVTLLSIAFNA
jgi:hypothetical protein